MGARWSWTRARPARSGRTRSRASPSWACGSRSSGCRASPRSRGRVQRHVDGHTAALVPPGDCVAGALVAAEADADLRALAAQVAPPALAVRPPHADGHALAV